MKRIFLAGEGRNELGGWYYPRPYRTKERGVLEILLQKIVPSGWAIKDAIVWSDIVKSSAGNHRKPETKNVLGAALKARELGCDVFIFSRDRDKRVAREKAIEAALEEISQDTRIAVAGGVAIEELESWVLSCTGHPRAESLSDAKSVAMEKFSKGSLAEQLQGADLDNLPEAAVSLHKWVARVRKVLSE